MCKLVIDTGALTRNLEKLRHYTSARIIAVVKGGGYGLGLAPYAQWLTAQGVDMLAVSSAAEAAALRDAGITADVLMLSSTALPEEVSALLARNVILTVGSFDAAHTVSAVAAQQGVTARVHIKLDTGMGRCGFLPGDVREAAALLRFLPALRMEGVFTHFADAANRRRTARQYRRFTAGVRILRTAGIDPGLRHVCASTAFLRYPEMHLDAVRLGSALLGRLSVPDTLGLEKVGWLETRVAELEDPARRLAGGLYRRLPHPAGDAAGAAAGGLYQRHRRDGGAQRPAPAGQAAPGAPRGTEPAAHRRPYRADQRPQLSCAGCGGRRPAGGRRDGAALRRGRHGARGGAPQVRGQRHPPGIPMKKQRQA